MYKKIGENLNCNLHKELQCFLLNYRITPHCVTKESPSKLMLGRQLKTRFDLLRPSYTDKPEKLSIIQHRIQVGQQRNKIDKGGKERQKFCVGNLVYCKDYRGRESKWIAGIIKRILGRNVYLVSIVDTPLVWKRHVNQIVIREIDTVATDNHYEIDVPVPQTQMTEIETGSMIQDNKNNEEIPEISKDPVSISEEDEPPPVRPQRTRKQPDRLTYD